MKSIEELKNKIIEGDCMEVLKEIPDNSIDTIITDPPYGLEFMGKDWDKFGVSKGRAKRLLGADNEGTGDKFFDYREGASKRGRYSELTIKEKSAFQEFNYNWAKEALRVAKPGATMLCFGGTRTFHRLACAIEDAGWIIKDTLMWIYGCLSEDTEIFTINGWEHYHKDIDKYPVLCYNVNNDKFEFHKPIRKFLYENEYPAYRIKSDFTDQIVSRNHRVLIEREGKFIFQRAEALQPEENIPILESLQDLPETIYDFQSHTSIKKSDLLKRVSKNSNTKKQEKEAISRKKDEKVGMLYLWQRVLASLILVEKKQKSLLFKKLFGKSKRLVKEDRIFGQEKLDRKEFRKLSQKNDWGKQPILEGWSNIFQKTRKLFANKICQVSERFFGYGSERWLCYGTSAYNGTEIGQTIIKNGSSSSYQSQSSRQQNRESYTISKQQRTQTIRSTRAKIEEIEYKGNVWCVEVPTGAFVARRNGKIFITGNSGFPKATDISQMLDKDKCRKQLEIKLGRKPTKEEFKKEWKGFRKIIGKKENIHSWKTNRHRAWNSESKSNFEEVNQFTQPATPEAKLWNGWKSHGLKPAWEPIIMAMKPNDGSYAENALKWGVAGLNIDGGRIGIDKVKAHHAPKGTFAGGEERKSDTNYYNNQGRFPANLILDEESAEMLDSQSGILKSGAVKRFTNYGAHQPINFGGGMLKKTNGSQGGASRFFYVAKASRAERNMGCENMEEKIDCDRNPKLNSANVPMNRSNNPKQNIHPTVKPLKLMEYLCVLTKTPSGGIILDPFAGSGTTCIAAIKTGRDFIGIEKEPEYVRIAEARINYWKQKNEEQNKQQTLL